jgi:transporter family-2 protein
MKWIFYLLPLLAGIAMSVQSGLNAQLRTQFNHPVLAALISFLAGTVALLLVLLFSRQPMPSFQEYLQTDWWKFTGGLFGAFIVTATIISISQIGASNMFVIIITGQLLTALIMDHYGLLGMPVQQISWNKVGGMLLLVAGAYLVNKK